MSEPWDIGSEYLPVKDRLLQTRLDNLAASYGTLNQELTRVKAEEHEAAHALDCIRQDLSLQFIDRETADDTRKRIMRFISTLASNDGPLPKRENP